MTTHLRIQRSKNCWLGLMMSDTDQINPYAGRDHESSQGLNSTDLPAIAALVGTTTGELKKIDERNLGDSSFTQALKMNPTQAVKSIIGSPGSSIPQSQSTHNPPPLMSSPPPVSSPPPMDISSLESRVLALEKFMETQKRDLKFKRGITYDIATSTIKGNFRNPSDILDIVLTELAKNTKTITLKLCDANKSSK